MAKIERAQPGDLPFKREPDGSIVLLQATKFVAGTDGQGNVTIYLEGQAPTLKRAKTFQAVLTPKQATQMSTAIENIVSEEKRRLT